MNLDGLTLSVLIRELNELVGNGQIQRIQQIDKTSILLKINTPTTSPYLVITVGSYRYDSGCPKGAHLPHYVFTETY